MTTVYVKTPWVVVSGANRMAVAEDYSAVWTDITGQAADVVPPTTNLMLAQGDVSAAQKTALEADDAYVVSTSLDTTFRNAASAYTDDIYAAPDGGAEAVGTAINPVTLAEGMTRLTTGATLYLKGGVYAVTANTGAPWTVKADITLAAADAEIPVITHTDGGIPALYVDAGTTVRGVWFGGAKGEDRAVTRGNSVMIEGCVFWNYTQCISEGSSTRGVYDDNLFINCGTDWLQHSIYISNYNATADEAARILNNTFIGGAGYHVHLWHGPSNTVIEGNFSATSHAALVIDGPGNLVQNNVWWSQRADISVWPLNLSANGAGTYTNNLHGEAGRSSENPREWRQTAELPNGLSAFNNAFVGNVEPFGTAPVAMAVDDLTALLGYSKSQIDAAVAALETSFAENVATVQADSSILGNWAILRYAALAWRTT